MKQGLHINHTYFNSNYKPIHILEPLKHESKNHTDFTWIDFILKCFKKSNLNQYLIETPTTCTNVLPFNTKNGALNKMVVFHRKSKLIDKHIHRNYDKAILKNIKIKPTILMKVN